MLVGTDRAKHRRGPVSLDRLKLPHRPGPKPRVEVPDQEKIGGAAASAKKVLPGGLIGVGNARIQDPRLHVEAGGGDVERHNGAAVAVGRGVGVQVWEAKAGKIGERKWGADEVSGLVKALDPLKSRCSIRPCDDEAAVRKGGHVAEVLGAGNPHGNRHRTRHLLNQEFMQALLLHFRQHGKKAIEKVARNQPAAYVKILALLVPREMQIEHTNHIKQMTDEEIEQAIELIQTMLAARAGEAAKVIEGTAEPAALPAPNRPSPEAALEATLEPTKRKPNRLMMEADTAVGPKERKPRQRKMPSPASA